MKTIFFNGIISCYQVVLYNSPFQLNIMLSFTDKNVCATYKKVYMILFILGLYLC